MCLGSARRDPASSGLAATRSRSACHFGGGPGFPETRGAAVSCVCLGAMRDVRTACVLFASSLPRGIVNHFFSERGGRALSFLTRHGDAGDDARVARRQSRERNAEMVRRRASKWRARVRRGDALFSGTPRSLFPVVVKNAPTLSHSGSFRTEILDSRSFDSRSFARFFHAESSLEIPRKIETHNLRI